MTIKQAAEQLVAELAEDSVEPPHRHLVAQLKVALRAEHKARRLGAIARWGKISPEERRSMTAAACVASSVNKPGRKAAPTGGEAISRATLKAVRQGKV